MALVSDIQLQTSAVKPPNLDTSQKFSAEGLTATTAFAVTDGGAGTAVTPLGLITVQSANNASSYFSTTKANGDVNLYLNNDENPYWNLKLSATAGTADSFMIANSCGTNGTAEYPAFSISPVGAVGIGKTGAASILDITYADSSTGGINLTESTNTVVTKIISLATCSVMGTSSNHPLGFIQNNTTRAIIDNSGQFGIGTCAPGAMLDVRGSAKFNEDGAAVDFRIEGDTEANLFFVDGSTDRIGIGTATPCVLLDIDNGGDGTGVLMCVNGCICAAGYLGEKQGHTIETAGVALTQRTGLNFVVTDVGTVTDDSSNDATVVCISGANTCVPFELCTGASDPISLVGGSIGNQLANDSTPTLGGLLCGDSNSMCAINCITITGCYFGDGSQLTGVSSVPGCYSGDCTIIGCSAGGNVAAGATNVVLYGANAGYNFTTGDNVVLIGSSVALCMTTATDQVIIGTSAGRCVLTCAGNVAIGAHAFYNECAGTYNTVVGDCAGHTQKGATTNTFIGALAGALDSTGSGNIFIGYKAGCANTTCSCCLVIGNGTCDLITGDFNSGYVGIATTTPQRPLHVSSPDNVGTVAITSSLAATGCWNGIEFGYTSTRKAGIFFERTGNNYVGKLHFATENTQDASEVDLTDTKMTIDDAGNVGIGTTAPTTALEVNGAITTTAAAGLNLGTQTINGSPAIVFGGSNAATNWEIKQNDAVSGDLGFTPSTATGGTTFTTFLMQLRADISTVCIAGALSKNSGSFRIEHPLESKKDTHDLVHSFIEGPQADLIYSGIIQLSGGAAIVNVDTEAGMTDGTFVALNRCTRIFTSNESNWDAVRGSITGNTLTIESNVASSAACISWMVVGERCDQHMMDTSWTDDDGKVIVEPLKEVESASPE